MEFTSPDILSGLGTDVTPRTSDYADHLITGQPFVREYSFFSGRVVLKLQTMRADVAEAATHLAETESTCETVLKDRIDTYLAVASVKSLVCDAKPLQLEPQTPTAWLAGTPYQEICTQLSNEQLQLVVETYREFQRHMDDLRKQLSALA